MSDIKAIVTNDGQVIDETQIASYVIISRPRVVRREVVKQKCPNCRQDQAFLIERIAWYGEDATCLVCGDRWQDGELCPRPLERAWRRRSVEHALARLSLPVEEDINFDMLSDDEESPAATWSPFWHGG
jgi:hypothetical protein